MLAWWRRRSTKAKGRLVFYPGLVAVALGFGLYTMAMPGKSHHGALVPLDREGEALATRLRADVTALVGKDVERSQRSAGSLERAAPR